MPDFGAAEPILVRPGSDRDIPAIARIQTSCPEAAQWPLGDYAGLPLLVAIVGDRVAGFCVWRQVALDEAELLNIAVHPAFRRRGIGSALLSALGERVNGPVFLEVAETNAPARAFYEKYGWEQIGTRPRYYGETINAIVMNKRSW